MVDVVEISPNEEVSESTVSPKRTHPKSGKATPTSDFEKSRASDSPSKPSRDKSPKSGQANKSGKYKPKKNYKDKSPKKSEQASKDEHTNEGSTEVVMDVTKTGKNGVAPDADESTKADDSLNDRSANGVSGENQEESTAVKSEFTGDTHREESSNTDSGDSVNEEVKKEPTDDSPRSEKDESSKTESSETEKEKSPKKNIDEPVQDNSPVSSDDEAPSPGSFTVKTNELYHENDQGKELFVKGDYEAAIKMWSRSIDNLAVVLDKARTNPDHDITEEILHDFTKMYVIFCSNLALAYIKKGDYEKSKEYCQHVLMYDDKSLKAHLRIVQADIHLKNFEQALKNCNKGLEFHPDNKELLALKNQINEHMKTFKNIEKEFCKNAFRKVVIDPRKDKIDDPFIKSLIDKHINKKPSSDTEKGTDKKTDKITDETPDKKTDSHPDKDVAPPVDSKTVSQADKGTSAEFKDWKAQLLSNEVFVSYYNVFLVVRNFCLSLAGVFTSARSRVKHTLTSLTGFYTVLLKKVKLS